MYIFFSVLLYLCPVDVDVVAAEVLVKQINLNKLVGNLCRKSPDLFHRVFCTSSFLFCSCRFLLRIFILINALFPEWCFIFFKHVLFLQSTFCIWKNTFQIFARLCHDVKSTNTCLLYMNTRVTIRAWRHDHELFVLILFFSSGIRVLVDAREKLHIPWGKPSNQQHGDAMMAFDTRSTMLQGHGMVEYKVFQFYLPSIRALWADEGIQTAYDRRREFQLVSQIMSQRWHSLCIQKSSDSNT